MPASVECQTVKGLGNIFNIPIYKITPFDKDSRFYQAVTEYGNMCLIIEQYENTVDQVISLEFLESRNRAIKENSEAFPLIYEQHFIQKGSSFQCMTLLQTCTPFKQWAKEQQGKFVAYNFGKIINACKVMKQQGFRLEDRLSLDHLLFLGHSEEISVDFTEIKPLIQNQPEDKDTLFIQLKDLIVRLLSQKHHKDDRIQEVILIKDKMYVFNPEKLSEANDYDELLLLLNICPHMNVELIAKTSLHQIEAKTENEIVHTETASSSSKHVVQEEKTIDVPKRKKKILEVNKLEGTPIISIHQKYHDCLHFEQGKCLNSLRQIFYEQLAQRFIKDRSLYKLQQFEYLTVHIFQNKTVRNEQIITVYPPVGKLEFNNFLFAYIKCIKPIIKEIVYFASENTLRIVFINQRNEEKVLCIVFYDDYIVKDQQIQILLSHSELSHVKLDLRNTQISAGFFSFLAHQEKASNISQLYLSDKYGVTDVGITSFLRSHTSDNLQTLNLIALNHDNTLLNQSIEIIAHKSKLQKLYIKKNWHEHHHIPEIDVSFLNLTEFQSIGIKVQLRSIMGRNLKILRIDQMVPVEELKTIKHIKLKELKIRLHQYQKKSLIQSFSDLSPLLSFDAFNSKLQAVKEFSENSARRALKILDISHSNCKFKTLSPLFEMPELQNLSLDGCQGLSTDFSPISSKITSLSLSNTSLNLDQVAIILQNMQRMMCLNIIHTDVKRQDIGNLMKKTKIFVKNLIISEEQYTNKLLELSKNYQRIQSVELFVERLLEPEQEFSFNYILMKVSEARKILRLRVNNLHFDEREIQNKRQILVEKIHKFLLLVNIAESTLSNFYINDTKVTDLLRIRQNFEVEDSVQSLVASEVLMGTHGCRIISLPKIQFRKNHEIPILFKALKEQTIDQFVHRFIKFMKGNNDQFMTVDLSENKLIGDSVINVLLKHGKNLIKQLNFKGCVFSFNQIVDKLFQFVGLQYINHGEYSIYLDSNNFNERSNRYLKLLMHSKGVKQLKIQCVELKQSQTFYQILSHILDQCSPTIRSLSISFKQISVNEDSKHFFETVFALGELLEFHFYLENCEITSNDFSLVWQQGLSKLRKLRKIHLSLPSLNFPIICLENLIDVKLEFCDGQAEEGPANRCLRNLVASKGLKNLDISFSNSPKIVNVLRVFSMIPVGCIFEKLINLEHLNLNFEQQNLYQLSCPLKQQSLFELLLIIPKCRNLKMLELNVSFAFTSFSDLVGTIEKMIEEFDRPISAKIICVNNFALRTETMSQKGIEFII